MRALALLAAAVLLSPLAVSAPEDGKSSAPEDRKSSTESMAVPDGPVRLEIALDKKEYPFRGAIAVTITYTNVSDQAVTLWANGLAPGEGFAGETFEITSGAGRTTYTVVGIEPAVQKITIEPGKSWKRTIKDLAPVLSNGAQINGRVSLHTDPLPDPFGQRDDYTIRMSFQSAVKNMPKPAFNGPVASKIQKFRVQ